ncbi:DEAD/DEAH box helicase [Rhodoplanes sp. SY1]|uniref:DEAD/DEAH box helicase n=1 Tax=Rhodoplanes sp. SY1 TaxID=3166646 RepID=UPI0038B43E36
MTIMFTTRHEPDRIVVSAQEKRLLSRRSIPVAEWSLAGGSDGIAAACLLGLVERGDATASETAVMLTHRTAARLPGRVAEAIGLPGVASLAVTLSFEGNIGTAGCRIRTEWQENNSRLVRPVRQGIIVTWGERKGRLSAALLDLLEAVDDFNAVSSGSDDQRITAWQPVQEALRRTTDQAVRADGFLGSLTIYQAGSFALDVRETRDGPDFTPVLMSRAKAMSLEDDAPVADGEDDEGPSAEAVLRSESADALLPPMLQREFEKQYFGGASGARDAYVFRKNTFVVVDPDLKLGLDVVRRKRSASADERRAFVRNPRPALAETLEQAGRVAPAVSLFVETAQYSDRVLGLGVWDPPKLPWLTRRAGQWLPEAAPDDVQRRSPDSAPEAGPAGADETGAAHSPRSADDARDAEPLAGGEQLASADGDPGSSASDGRSTVETGTCTAGDRQVLQIKANVDGVEYLLEHPPRTVRIERALPYDRLGDTAAKPHQEVGFDWLIRAWAAGWPGVLLADDMGLGKTFQALAFLAWLRKNQQAPGRGPEPPRGPILVVGPTALLRNWIAEAEKHLAPGALGECVDAFGPGLARIRRRRTADWTPEDSVDTDTLRSAGWVLTTYETLADNHRAFARVGFAVAVFDEMQKVKAPGTINTHAAKAINADFVLGLTGTPIENRIEDLWCIMDRIAPGYLGDLKGFSSRYGGEDADTLTELKGRLDLPRGATPAIMLRRMKDSILEGLPEKTVRSHPVTMPPPQAEAYAAAVAAARNGDRDRGAMLKVIHALRGISLHPDGAGDVDPYDPVSVSAWVARSARLSQAVSILRDVRSRSEKAIVFVEDLAVQKAFAAASVPLFGLAREPAIINGSVPGEKRQAIVDRFQKAPRGFDLLVLSPKAAGIGLTITAANHVVHLSRWWNPAVEDQCNDRVYRIGQDRPVTIHVLLATHPEFGDASFDVTLDNLLSRKRALSRHMLAPPVQESDIDVLFGAVVAATLPSDVRR